MKKKEEKVFKVKYGSINLIVRDFMPIALKMINEKTKEESVLVGWWLHYDEKGRWIIFVDQDGYAKCFARNWFYGLFSKFILKNVIFL